MGLMNHAPNQANAPTTSLRSHPCSMPFFSCLHPAHTPVPQLWLPLIATSALLFNAPCAFSKIFLLHLLTVRLTSPLSLDLLDPHYRVYANPSTVTVILAQFQTTTATMKFHLASGLVFLLATTEAVAASSWWSKAGTSRSQLDTDRYH